MNQLIEADAEFYFMRQTEFKEFIVLSVEDVLMIKVQNLMLTISQFFKICELKNINSYQSLRTEKNKKKL